MDYEAKIGLDRSTVRKIAYFIRKMLDIKTIKFPVLKALGKLENKFDSCLYCSVLPDTDFEYKVMAEMVPEGDNKYCIKIRQTVYNDAAQGKRSSLGFICHEMCHFILVHVFNIGPKMQENDPVFARSVNKIPAYKSMEWQAMALCGEIMIPYDECKDYTFKEIVSATESSDAQAQYFLNHVVKKR